MIVFALSLTVILGKYILDQFYSEMNAGGFTTPKAVEVESSMKTNFLMFDYAMVGLTVIMLIGLMITSFMIPTHPIFVVVNVIGIFVLVFIGMILTNSYGEIVAGTDSMLSATADSYPKINFLMSILPFIAAVAVFLSSIIMYARGYSG